MSATIGLEFANDPADYSISWLRQPRSCVSVTARQPDMAEDAKYYFIAEVLKMGMYTLSTVGDRAFPVARCRLWNSLPPDVTSASTLSVFSNCLKTYLFS